MIKHFRSGRNKRPVLYHCGLEELKRDLFYFVYFSFFPFICLFFVTATPFSIFLFGYGFSRAMPLGTICFSTVMKPYTSYESLS